jgi:hypothetical protein
MNLNFINQRLNTNFKSTSFRGLYREYDSRGYDVFYNEGDIVLYEGKQYIALFRNNKSIPTIKKSIWKELSGDIENYYYSDSIPLNANVGDRWVDRLTGVMYTYIEDKNGFHWVEF